MLRNGVRRICGNTDNAKLTACISDIDVVEAGTAQSDSLDSQRMQTVDDSGIDRIVDKDTDSICTRCQIYGILIELCFVIFDFDSRICRTGIKSGLVVWLGIKECK